MKKSFAVIVVLAVIATLTGCGTTGKMIPIEGSGGRYSAISVTEKGFNGHDATIIALVEEGSQLQVQAQPALVTAPVAATPKKSSVVVKKTIKADSWRQKCPSPKQRYDIRHEDRTETTEETVVSEPPPPPAPAPTPAPVIYKSQARIVGMYGGGNEAIGNSILKGIGAAVVGSAGYVAGQAARRPDSNSVNMKATGGAGGAGGSASSSSSSSSSASAAAAAAAAAAAE